MPAHETQARPYIGVPGQPQSPVRRGRFADNANRLLRRQAIQQPARGHRQKRVPPVGRNLDQRGQDEPAFVQPRMGQGEALAVALAALIVEQVDVEGAGRVRRAAPAPEPNLKREQRAE